MNEFAIKRWIFIFVYLYIFIFTSAFKCFCVKNLYGKSMTFLLEVCVMKSSLCGNPDLQVMIAEDVRQYSLVSDMLVYRDCKVIRDPQTHKSKGYGFVCFVHKEASLFIDQSTFSVNISFDRSG